MCLVLCSKQKTTKEVDENFKVAILYRLLRGLFSERLNSLATYYWLLY